MVSVLRTDFEQTYHTLTPRFGTGGEARLRALATALSVSPQWKEMPRAVLVARSTPTPMLGVVGYFDAAGRASLEGLRSQLDNLLPRLRFVDYAQAEEDCERLAARLVERFGRDELMSFRFTAIPRGGFIVLGMLAYVLGLRRSQLEPHHAPETPLVVVDDCALSGVRFERLLERLENRRVVFAHLYSPPQLREVIEARELRRVTCVSACDLRDHAPALQGEGYDAWRERWLARMDHHGYWVGQPDHVCFAWNEPDSSVWNPVTEREESGWRFVPPELCLKNRLPPGEKPIQVQVQPAGKGPLGPSSHVLFGELEGEVVVGDLETKECFTLSDVGADMWRAIVRHGNLEEAMETLLKNYDVDEDALRTDLREFADDLLSQGLLRSDG